MEQTCNYYKNTGSLKAAFHIEMHQTSYIFQIKNSELDTEHLCWEPSVTRHDHFGSSVTLSLDYLYRLEQGREQASENLMKIKGTALLLMNSLIVAKE